MDEGWYNNGENTLPIESGKKAAARASLVLLVRDCRGKTPRLEVDRLAKVPLGTTESLETLKDCGVPEVHYRKVLSALRGMGSMRDSQYDLSMDYLGKVFLRNLGDRPELVPRRKHLARVGARF